MKIKQSFVTNSSSTAFVLIGKRITPEEFKLRFDNNTAEGIVAVELETSEYPFSDELEEIASKEDFAEKYRFYDDVKIQSSCDWGPEFFSLAKLMGTPDIEKYDVVVCGTGGAY